MFGNAKQNQTTKFMTKFIILLAISTVLINCNNTTMNEQKNDNTKKYAKISQKFVSQAYTHPIST